MTCKDDLSVLAHEPFVEHVKNLRKLLETRSALTFLFGAGCSKCAGLTLTEELSSKVLSGGMLDKESMAILSAIEDGYGHGSSANIEDYLSELIDLFTIAERRAERGTGEGKVLLGETSFASFTLKKAIDQVKQAVASIIDKKVSLQSLQTHRDFVASVHQPMRAGRGPRDRSASYVVLNYDTLIEDALALEKKPYSDGIDGGVTGWWNPETLDREGLAAQVLKLHGSVNWFELPNDPLPRRVGYSVELQEDSDWRILIWPASTKYREAQLDPFAQLMERARIAIRANQGLQRLLLICGYSFGDAHINDEIETALYESEGNLVVVAFTNEDTLTGKLAEWNGDETIRDDLLVYANRGYFKGDTADLSCTDLPWWKFENLTRILQGEQ